MKFKVFVTRMIPEAGLDILKEECEVRLNPCGRPLKKEEMLESVGGVDGLICRTDAIDEEIMDENPHLKIISNFGVGYNHIDVKAATTRGIMVTNTPGVLTDTTADLTWALLMSVARRIVEADRFVRGEKHEASSTTLFLGTDIHHATLGIVGFGRIGRAVAKRSKGFHMRILYADLVRAPRNVEEDLGAKFTSLGELLQNSDFVTLHPPLTPETRHMISKKELRLMKEGAYLINAGRGPLVDEKALVQALRENWIAGAGLDVYENEPNLAAGLPELNNVVLLPHIGSATMATRAKIAVMAANNLVAGLKGEVPPNLVNKKVLRKQSL